MKIIDGLVLYYFSCCDVQVEVDMCVYIYQQVLEYDRLKIGCQYEGVFLGLCDSKFLLVVVVGMNIMVGEEYI